MLGVADALDAGQVAQLTGLALGRAGQHRVDRGRDEFDVTELLGGDARHQVIKRAGALAVAEVERLIRVVHERRHLAVLAAQQLLDGGSADGIWIRRRRQLGLQTIDTQYHGVDSSVEQRTNQLLDKTLSVLVPIALCGNHRSHARECADESATQTKPASCCAPAGCAARPSVAPSSEHSRAAPTEHLSADEVYARAAESLPDLSRGTVYATLAEFSELGLLSAFGAPEPVRYETNTTHHSHFRCRLCLRTFDLVSGLQNPEEITDAGFSVERVDTRAEGICAECNDYDAGLRAGARAIATVRTRRRHARRARRRHRDPRRPARSAAAGRHPPGPDPRRV